MANKPRQLTPHVSPRDFFGAELRRHRELAGLSTAQLGDLVHYSGDLIGKIEKAQRWPKPVLAAALDEALETDGSFTRLFALVEAQRTSQEAGAHESGAVQLAQDEFPLTLPALIESALADAGVDTAGESTRPGSVATRLASGHPTGGGVPQETAGVIADRLVERYRQKLLPAPRLRELGLLAGHVVDLNYALSIDIGRDGRAIVRADQTLVNLTSRPIARLVRDFWFEHTDGSLMLFPFEAEGGSLVAMQKIHSTPNFIKFASQLSPPVQPGETATVRYACQGGKFADAYYWRQSLFRFAQRFTLSVRHRGARPLLQCSGMEEFADGSEVSANEDLAWSYKGDDVLVSLTRYSLRPNQALTLRWEATTGDVTQQS
jgi:transcriptional regulator with XRE-family HTH domain